MPTQNVSAPETREGERAGTRLERFLYPAAILTAVLGLLLIF